MAKKNLTGYLDALIDQDGFKTDLTVSIPKENLLQISAFLVGTVAVGAIAWFTIRAVFHKLQTQAQ